MSLTITNPLQQTIPLNAVDLHHQLGEVLERVHYRFDQFQIMRKDKPMARLVNEQYIQAMERLVQENPALAETLEIMLDPEFMAALKQGDEEIAEGELIPLGHAMKD